MNKSPHEHGTMQAYVTGFILSLIFTFIPYFIVTHKVTTGTSLLITILGFGVLQMLVQVTFFLHLGRGPKPNYNLFFFVSTVGVIMIVVGGSLVIIHNLHYNMMAADQVMRLTNDEGIAQIGGQKTGACAGQHLNHQVIIKNGKVTPANTTAQQCDTLTFSNQDNPTREIIFSEQLESTSYAGETRYSVRKQQNKTITLSELGSYTFRDYLQPSLIGTFTVTK